MRKKQAWRLTWRNDWEKMILAEVEEPTSVIAYHIPYMCTCISFFEASSHVWSVGRGSHFKDIVLY